MTLKISIFTILIFGLLAFSINAEDSITLTFEQAYAETEPNSGRSAGDQGEMTDKQRDGILGAAFGMIGFLAVALCVVALLHIYDAIFGTKMIRPHAKLTYSLGFGGLILFLAIAAYSDTPEAQARRQVAREVAGQTHASDATSDDTPDVIEVSRNSDEYKACSTASLLHALGMSACIKGANTGELERAVWDTRKVSDRLYDFARHNLLQACYAEQSWPGSIGVPDERYNRSCVGFLTERTNDIDVVDLLRRDEPGSGSSSPRGNTLSHQMCEAYMGLVRQGLQMCRSGIPISTVDDMASSARRQDRRLYAYIIASWRKGCAWDERVDRQLHSGFWREDCAAFINGR